MKPILFNSEMVKAILGGRKTVTRRVIKIPPDFIKEYRSCWNDGAFIEDGKLYWETQTRVDDSEIKEIKPPYRAGDVLYVRETWFCSSCANCDGDIADGVCSKRDNGEEPTGCYFYKADNNNFEWDDKKTHWRPSIHMPKEAARIFLKVTDIRVEKLKEITFEGIAEEGVNPRHFEDENGVDVKDFVNAYIHLWDSTIKKENLHLYGWNANPYVWVIEFERCKKPESEG